jgi:hypothetical protein
MLAALTFRTQVGHMFCKVACSNPAEQSQVLALQQFRSLYSDKLLLYRTCVWWASADCAGYLPDKGLSAVTTTVDIWLLVRAQKCAALQASTFTSARSALGF